MQLQNMYEIRLMYDFNAYQNALFSLFLTSFNLTSTISLLFHQACGEGDLLQTPANLNYSHMSSHKSSGLLLNCWRTSLQGTVLQMSPHTATKEKSKENGRKKEGVLDFSPVIDQILCFQYDSSALTMRVQRAKHFCRGGN